jgi:hypothetical protein
MYALYFIQRSPRSEDLRGKQGMISMVSLLAETVRRFMSRKACDQAYLETTIVIGLDL